jgi:hypothetical protein
MHFLLFLNKSSFFNEYRDNNHSDLVTGQYQSNEIHRSSVHQNSKHNRCCHRKERLKDLLTIDE